MNAKREMVKRRIIDSLQEMFYVTDAELIAPSINPIWVSADDALYVLQAQYGVVLSPRVFKSWMDVVSALVNAICRAH